MSTTRTTNHVYGYCRISTKKQSIERQVRNIKEAYPDAVILQEAYTGTKVQGRKELDKLLRTVKPGDVIVFDSVSRMSRNAAEGFALYKKLFAEGIELVFLKEPAVNTSTYKSAMDKQMPTVKTGDADTDKLMNTIMTALMEYTMTLAEKQIKLAFEQSEKEVQDLRQRTKEGLVTARLNGKQVGNEKGKAGYRSKLTTKKSKAAKEIIRKHSRDFAGTLKDDEVMKLAGISRNTYYAYKKQLSAEFWAELGEV